MVNPPLLSFVAAGVAGSLVTISSVDIAAMLARPIMNMPRSSLCASLLSTGAKDMTFEDETAGFLYAAQTHILRKAEFRGEFEIHLAMGQAKLRFPTEGQGSTDPVNLASLQTYKDYRASRFALEFGDLDRVLVDYAAGKSLNVTILGVSRVGRSRTFSTFAVASATSAWRWPHPKQTCCWHILAGDPDLNAPVRRAGKGEF